MCTCQPAHDITSSNCMGLIFSSACVESHQHHVHAYTVTVRMCLQVLHAFTTSSLTTSCTLHACDVRVAVVDACITTLTWCAAWQPIAHACMYVSGVPPHDHSDPSPLGATRHCHSPYHSLPLLPILPLMFHPPLPHHQYRHCYMLSRCE